MLARHLRTEVLEANLSLVRNGLVIETFGNASGIDRDNGMVVIKPSGVPYDKMKSEDLVVTDLTGAILEGHLRPSSDLPTHIALYQNFPAIGGVAHTHSRHATAWAQARREIPCFGTTHADHFYGTIPVTDVMTPQEIANGYEWNTGMVIVRRFEGLDPMSVKAVLVAGHAPFTWGKSVTEACYYAYILEELAQLAMMTVTIQPTATAIAPELLNKHYLRKHGPEAYYGQK